jgi:hypothetical protein
MTANWANICTNPPYSRDPFSLLAIGRVIINIGNRAWDNIKLDNSVKKTQDTRFWILENKSIIIW